MYLTKHPCTSIVVVFSPVLIYMHSSLHPRGGWKKRAQETPVRKSFVFASRTLSFCTRGIAANAHLLYSDHCGACDEKKMSGFENQTRVGFQGQSLSFRTESRRTRLIFSRLLRVLGCFLHYSSESKWLTNRKLPHPLSKSLRSLTLSETTWAISWQ